MSGKQTPASKPSKKKGSTLVKAVKNVVRGKSAKKPTLIKEELSEAVVLGNVDLSVPEKPAVSDATRAACIIAPTAECEPEVQSIAKEPPTIKPEQLLKVPTTASVNKPKKDTIDRGVDSRFPGNVMIMCPRRFGMI